MKNARRFGAIVTTALAAASIALSGASPAAAAAARPNGPWPTTQLPAVDNGETQWVSVFWKTTKTLCDAQVRVWGGPNVDIDYPSNTGDYTSFAHGPTLQRHETDYTSFQVTPHFRKPTVTWLNATITYNNCGWHARTQSRSTGFPLRVSGWSAP